MSLEKLEKNADYHDSSIADECSREIAIRRKREKKRTRLKSNKWWRRQVTCNNLFMKEIKETKLLPFDIHTHTCPHQMVYSWLLAYSMLNADERDDENKKYTYGHIRKGANDDNI